MTDARHHKPSSYAPHCGLGGLARSRRAIGLLALMLLAVSAGPLLAEEASTQPASSDGSAAEAPRAIPVGPLRMNFQDVPLQAILAYLSEAAGLVIVEPAPVDGRVTVISRQPVSVKEAVALLDTVLRERGYASLYAGRTLKIVLLEDAKTSNIPVRTGNDPKDIEPSDRVITQIIPVRYVSAVKLKTDLASLFPDSADVAANEASNSLIVTDSQAIIRRIVEIVRALDQHMSGVAQVRVFQLEFADAANTTKLITEVFRQEDAQPSQGRLTGFAARMQMMMRGGRRGGRGDGGDQAERVGLASQHVVAAADERTNALVVSAPPELMTIIEQVITELDSNPAEEQTVFLYQLKNAQAENVVEVLNNIFDEDSRGGSRTAQTTRGGRTTQTGRFSRRFTPNATAQGAAAGGRDLVGDVYCVADVDTNSLLVRTSSQNIERVKAILAKLDRPIRQVLIKVLIAEVTHDETLDLGGQFSVLNLRLGTEGEYTFDVNTEGETGGSITATMDSGLTATFNALRRDGRLDVLSRPYILASDNQEASIVVGEEVPFVVNTRTTETGQTLNTIEYEDIGIILNVTPHVNPDGLVIMDVAPEISSITDTTVAISDTADATVFSKRSAKTRVAIKDGQTIVIGGLMENRIAESIRKVPLLGDIPLLKLLFRRTVKSKVKTELLIFLTPHVAQQPGELKEISDAEKAGVESLKEAIGGETYDKHLKGMERGGDLGSRGDDDEAPR